MPWIEFKVNNYDPQEIGLWISTQLDPQVQFYFHKTIIDEKQIVLLEISAAYSNPVKFKRIDYIRIDSHKKKLKDFPDTERELWAIFSKKPFEVLTALENVSEDLILRLLDYSEYFEMLSLDLPTDKSSTLSALLSEGMLSKIILSAYQEYAKMSKEDKQRACYLHSCFLYQFCVYCLIHTLIYTLFICNLQ